MAVGMPEFVENPENRCPVILLLDTSGSMSGQPIQELNRGLAAFKEDVQKDSQASLSVEVAMITFGPIVKLTQDFVTIDQFTPPRLEVAGVTPMGAAIEYALDFLENRKQTYKDNGILYYRPWVFLITDGEPNDSWQPASQRLREAEAQSRLSFFAVGVKDADMNILKQISPPERPPVTLNGLDFRELFVWLSASVKRVSSGKVGQLEVNGRSTSTMSATDVANLIQADVNTVVFLLVKRCSSRLKPGDYGIILIKCQNIETILNN